MLLPPCTHKYIASWFSRHVMFSPISCQSKQFNQWEHIYYIVMLQLCPCSTGRRLYGVRKNEQIRSKIAEMVWWNISGATISHVLRINCVSMAHGWRTCCSYGVWMAMPLCMMSRMRTWPWRIHSASGVCAAYIPRTRVGQRDSMAYGGRLYSAWAAYMPNL